MSEQGFRLHERLAQDTVEVARWELSLVLLMRERLWPWLILVPRRAACREIHDLAVGDRALLIEEIARASRALEQGFDADKINLGAIGNMVPQLHVHLIARHQADAAWPKPVWGVTPPDPMDEAALAARLAQVRAALG